MSGTRNQQPVKQDKRRRPLVHGEKGYKRGCKCDICKRGHAAHSRDERARKAAARDAAMAGGPWPDRFAEIVDVLVLGGVSTDQVSPAAALLAAIRDVWPEDTERLATHQLAGLLAGHESGGFDWPEKVRATELSKRLRAMGVAAEPLWIDGKTMRGYDRAAMQAELAAQPYT